MSEKPPLAAVPQVERDKLAAAVEQFRRNLPLLIENNKILATLRREAYLAYIENGFNEAQALELCWK